MLTVCRRTKNGKEFLEYYTCKSEEETNKEVMSLNTTKPNTLWNGVKINWDTTKEFFVNKQESMY